MTAGNGWLTTWHGLLCHVVPEDDLREHDLSTRCWCVPIREDDDAIWLHNALDRRDEYERGERQPS